MFCSACGVAVAQGLKFCNHCGARLNLPDSATRPREIRPEPIIGAMVFVFIFGLAATALLTLLLSESVHLAPGQIMGFVGFSLLIMSVLEAVFITLLFRRKPREKETHENNRLPWPVTRELQPPPARNLSEQVPSVTEHTTRSFDPNYGGQSSKMN